MICLPLLDLHTWPGSNGLVLNPSQNGDRVRHGHAHLHRAVQLSLKSHQPPPSCTSPACDLSPTRARSLQEPHTRSRARITRGESCAYRLEDLGEPDSMHRRAWGRDERISRAFRAWVCFSRLLAPIWPSRCVCQCSSVMHSGHLGPLHTPVVGTNGPCFALTSRISDTRPTLN